MDALFRYLLTTPIDQVAHIGDLEEWWERHEAAHARFGTPFGTSVAGGFAADRLGYAFASGYSGAVQQLRPELAGCRAALCVTEAGGGSPRNIETTLTAEGGVYRLTGEKTFVTLGARADRLLVVAHEPRPDDSPGRKRIVVVDIDPERAGVEMRKKADTPFIPEIPHAAVTLAGVRVEARERLSGDGYLEVVKPFRTIEDIHVNAAILGMYVRFARIGGWPHAVVERCLRDLCALGALAGQPALSPATHLALAGTLESITKFLSEEVPRLAQSLPESTRTMLERDAALLGVAGSVRKQRRLTAWSSLSAG